MCGKNEKIEVTDEMIEAAIRKAYEIGELEEYESANPLGFKEIIEAALSVRNSGCAESPMDQD